MAKKGGVSGFQLVTLPAQIKNSEIPNSEIFTPVPKLRRGVFFPRHGPGVRLVSVLKSIGFTAPKGERNLTEDQTRHDGIDKPGMAKTGRCPVLSQ